MPAITPDEVEPIKVTYLPEEISEVINGLIKKKFYREFATIWEAEIVELLGDKWVKCENAVGKMFHEYTDAGWVVGICARQDANGEPVPNSQYFNFRRVK